MKVVGLVSGGKDSMYNLLLCREFGHEVVALANLLPADNRTDELDSFMYQSVGHQLLQGFSACCGLPLFRKKIWGSSICKVLDYTTIDGDEVEDLLTLLAYVKQQIPDLQAVASGAIASDYQRLRVEHVCNRLGLVSLAYMWMRPQRWLLQEMIDSGIEAILVKVAAMGLSPDQHLGKSLREMQPRLTALSKRFGCNICGEGGEYETLTLDCPLFTRACLVLDEAEVVLHSPDHVAPVGILRPISFHTQPKTFSGAECSANELPGQDSFLEAVAEEVPKSFRADNLQQPDFEAQDAACCDVQPRIRIGRQTGFLTVEAAPILAASSSSEVADCRAALSVALLAIQQRLGKEARSLRSAVFCRLFLRNMSCFGAANEVYKRFFPPVRPAARVCVQLALPALQPLILQLLLPCEESMERKVLHVQSISQWAPSCIGPYSQAVRVSGLIFCAGQIGLEPASMQLLDAVPQQIAQSFHSCKAVAVAMKANLSCSLLAVTLYSTPSARSSAPRALHYHLQKLLEEKDESEEDENDSGPRDTYLYVPAVGRTWNPIKTYLVVPGLPRGAAVEIHPFLSSDVDHEGAPDKYSRKAWIANLRSHEAEDEHILASPRKLLIWQFCKNLNSSSIVEVAKAALQALEARVLEAALAFSDAIGVLLYVRQTKLCANFPKMVEDIQAVVPEKLPVSVIPVLSAGPLPATDFDLLFEATFWRH